MLLTLCFALTRWVGADGEAVTVDAAELFLTALPMAGAWIASAIGLGWPLRLIVLPESDMPLTLQAGLGIAALLTLDSALGALGWLDVPWVVWTLTVGGIVLLGAQALRSKASLVRVRAPRFAWTCVPAIAVLLVASCSAPGWLWASEFGGYDALSYHLQLPKEWMHFGRILPLEHNVYSFLPGSVEAAYLHLMSLRGDAIGGVIDCQMLHALLGLLAAMVCGRAASRVWGNDAGSINTTLYLATPWVVVVGSLAYNEMAVNLLLACGVCAAWDERISPARRGIAIGVVAGAAICAKLTAVGFAALPLAALLLWNVPRKHWISAAACAGLAAGLTMLPFLLRNWAACGNPAFPFATQMFGAAHWSAEQVAIWRSGHMSDASIAERLQALWDQFFAYGFGARPLPAEPWKPQWAALPWLGLTGAATALLLRSRRRMVLQMLAVLILQILFWMACTHLKSRFLLPTAVPLSMLAAGGLAVAVSRPALTRHAHLVGGLCAMALVALACVPMLIYRGEAQGRPALAVGTVHLQTGDGLDNLTRRDLGSTQWPAVAVNWLVPPGSRVFLVGEATPLYYRGDRVAYTTVWDRGVLSAIMRQHPHDPEAMRAALRHAGFTHLLINPTMLTVWQREGWSDPALTVPALQDFAESACEPLFDYPSGITLYAIPES